MLTLPTLVNVMKAVGQIPTESDMIDLMREMDIDSSGTIDFYEFIHMIARHMHPNDTDREIRQAFDLFDHNQDGFITFNELKSTVEKHLQISVNDSELRQMIELADRSGSAAVSFDDFLHAAVCRTDRRQRGTPT